MPQAQHFQHRHQRGLGDDPMQGCPDLTDGAHPRQRARRPRRRTGRWCEAQPVQQRAQLGHQVERGLRVRVVQQARHHRQRGVFGHVDAIRAGGQHAAQRVEAGVGEVPRG
ncbi:hypothetical protein [Amycolatopsis sp. FDAARGOS 1241]|uniref:hypothetical protein n=1 Tax=Amycolatopsis sp. FDAARGOS 1241 TaxID=2778070 RepID=UPI001EF16C88|nr:hypothetical protein [Amycolatopsis sp. FDAARGOS 1241]